MKIGDYDVTLGCDPEIFILNTETQQYVCAAGVIPGTKASPFPVPRGMVQVDGFATEFGITPAKTIEGFRSRIRSVRSDLDKIVQSHNKSYKTVVKPTVHFTQKCIDEAPEEAKALGCDPDYNAYTGRPNPRPNADKITFRTGGGHVHIGWTTGVDPHHPEHFEACRLLTKQLDLYLGVPSIIFDGDSERRKLYGAPGAFRPKPYGMEYRVLSNAWLRDDSLVNFVYNQTIAGFKDLLEGKPKFIDSPMCKEIIESSSTNRAFYLSSSLKFDIPRPPKELIRKAAA